MATSFLPFHKLAPELQSAVAGFLDTDDLLSLNRVNRRLHALTTPILYTRIELDVLVYEPASIQNPYQQDNSYQVRRAQRRLIHTLAAHPHYTRYVHVLAWHLFHVEPPQPAPVPLPWLPFPGPLPHGVKTVPLEPLPAPSQIPPSALDLLAKLDMVHTARLHFARGELPADAPHVLFPRLHSVVLSGLVTPPIAGRVFHSPSRLRELVLDHIEAHPAFIADMMRTLATTCDSLQGFALRIPGNARSDEPFDVPAHVDVLRSFAQLAVAARRTMSYLQLALTRMVHGIVVFGEDRRPAHLREFVLPGLLADGGSWPALTTFELIGVSHLTHDDVVLMQRALCPNVVISSEDDTAPPRSTSPVPGPVVAHAKDPRSPALYG